MFARPVVPAEVPGRPRSELDLAASEEINKMETVQGQQTFDKHISKLKEQWPWLYVHMNTCMNASANQMVIDFKPAGAPGTRAEFAYHMTPATISMTGKIRMSCNGRAVFHH